MGYPDDLSPEDIAREKNLPRKPQGADTPIELQEDGFLSGEELIEMFQLRMSDPAGNDDRKLAKQFGLRPKEVNLIFKYYQLPQKVADSDVYEWKGPHVVTEQSRVEERMRLDDSSRSATISF